MKNFYKHLNNKSFARLIILAFVFQCQFVFGQDFLFENFNGPAGSTFPTGWSAVRNGAVGTDWVVQSPNPSKFPTLSVLGSNFAMCDGDAGGNGSTTNSVLTTPTVNTAAASLLYLSFTQSYRDWNNTPDDSAIVEIFNGTNWIAIQKKVTSTNNNGIDPESRTFDIATYKNANLKIRFRYVGTWPWFWAVDNVRIFQPPSNDIGVTAIVSPSGGCGLTASSLIKVSVSNFGSATQNSIPLTYRVNSNTPVSQTFPVSLAPGASMDLTFTTPGDFSVPGDYFISAWSQLTGDLVLTNDSVNNIKVTKGSASFGVLSYSAYTGTNLADLYPGWREGEGLTPIGVTSTFRPSEPIQTTFFGTRTATVNLYTNSRREWHVSPPIVPTNISGLAFKASVTQWLQTEADEMGSDDKVYIMVSNNCGVSWNPIRTYDRTSGLTNQLTNQTVSLISYAGQEIQLAVFATDGTIDDPEDYDFHMDSLRILNLPPNEVSVGSISSPLSGCSVGNSQLKVTIINGGTNPQTNFPICAKINGNVPVCQNYSGTLAPGATAEYTFTNLPILNTPGDYNIRVYTNLSNEYDRSNDTTTNYFFQNIPNVTTYPYAQSFEANNGGWIPGGTFSSWALGTPAKPTIHGAAAGTKAYVTGGLGNGTYNSDEKSFVLGPCMDFTTLTNPVFEMKAWWANEFSEDGAILQSTIDGGTSWQTVGALNDVSNWYTDNTVDGLNTLVLPVAVNNPRVAWSGGLNDGFGSDGWVLVKNDLKKLGGKSSVRLRVAFGAGTNNAGDGFAFDDIKIYEKADRDMAIVSFVRPLPGCGLTDTSKVRIRIKNVGKLALTNPSIGYKRAGGQAILETYTGTIDTNQYYTHTFSGVEDLSQVATYNFQGWTSVTNDAHRSNDTIKSVNFRKRGFFEDSVRFQSFTGPNLPNIWAGWSVGDGNPLPTVPTSQWRNAQPDQQIFFGKNVARMNMYGNTRQSWIMSPAYKIQNNAFLNFDVAITESFDTINDPTGGFTGTDDRLRIMVSTSCGDSWTEVFAVKSGDQVDRSFKKFKANLSAFAGQEIRFAFWATTFPVNNTNDYDLFVDNIFIESLEPLDAGITAILSPTISCGLTDSVLIKATVRNFGSQTISNFPVYYKINQINQIEQIFFGTLASGASGSLTFAVPANMSLSQPYNVAVGTKLVGDNNSTNNETSIDLTTLVAPFPPTPLSGFNGTNLHTIWKGWTEAKGQPVVDGPSAWTNGLFSGQTTLKINMSNLQKRDWILSPGIRVGSGNILRFQAGKFAVNGTGSATFDIDDSVSVMVSTDCGANWVKVFKLGASTVPALVNNMQPYAVSLDAYSNQEIRIGFRAMDGNRNDFVSDVYLSNVEITSSIQTDAVPLQLSFVPAPAQSVFYKDSTYQVSVRVSSLGAQSIAQVPVGVIFNNQVFLNTVFPSVINSGQTVTIPLGSFTPTVSGTNFVAKAFTALTGDEVATNDTLRIIYKVADITPVNDVVKGTLPVKVFPNPTRDLLFISGINPVDISRLRVTDILGKELTGLTTTFVDDSTLMLSMKGVSPGLYFIYINTGSRNERIKVDVR